MSHIDNYLFVVLNTCNKSIINGFVQWNGERVSPQKKMNYRTLAVDQETIEIGVKFAIASLDANG